MVKGSLRQKHGLYVTFLSIEYPDNTIDLMAANHTDPEARNMATGRGNNVLET